MHVEGQNSPGQKTPRLRKVSSRNHSEYCKFMLRPVCISGRTCMNSVTEKEIQQDIQTFWEYMLSEYIATISQINEKITATEHSCQN